MGACSIIILHYLGQDRVVLPKMPVRFPKLLSARAEEPVEVRIDWFLLFEDSLGLVHVVAAGCPEQRKPGVAKPQGHKSVNMA